MWGYWNSLDNPNVRNLKLYAIHYVVNSETSLLAARALKNKEVTKLTPWPGVEFSIDSDAGKALIGSPIGATMSICSRDIRKG